jgi:hypothetical protein
MPKRGYKEIEDEWLLLAINQAECIHSRKEIANKIVWEASYELTVTSKKQGKRKSPKIKEPKLIYLTELHLFQRLVFSISETKEKEQEVNSPASITELDLIVRYIAFIVSLSFRNSFYGVTGVCRFIYRYKFGDVREIHSKLLGDPDRYKNDDNYRTNRKMTREMIFERFSKYLRYEENHNGAEKHFQLRDDQDDLSLWQLITSSLNSFKPWQTECVPCDFKQDEAAFKDPNENVNEINRLHTLIHQDCLKTLTDEVPCAHPNASLGIPRFFAATSTSNGSFQEPSSAQTMPYPHDDQYNAHASGQRLEVLRRALAEQAEKLAKFIPEGALIVKVDGKDVASLNLDETNRVQFTVDDERAELIKIVSEKDQLVLGVHLLDEEVWQSPKREHTYVVRHHTGPRIVFRVRRTANAGGNDLLSVVVTYEKARLAQSFVFLKQWLADALATFKLATVDSFAHLLPSKSRAPLIAIESSSRLVLVSLLTLVALLPLTLFLLLGPSSFRLNVETARETNANSIVLQGRPPAIEQTETPSTTLSIERPEHLVQHNVKKPWAKLTTLAYQPIAKPLLPVGKSQREYCSRCIVHWTLMNRARSMEELIGN